MYIYNVTINIDEAIHDTWLEWMKHEHIPMMLNTGKFSKALMTKVQFEQEIGGITYSVQYRTDSKATLDRYYEENASEMRAHSMRFEGHFVAFRTELEIISEQ